MPTLSGADRSYLRGLAHHLKPVVYVGKSGITDPLIKSVDQALEAHELIKLKFNEFKAQKKSLARDIEAQTHSEMVGMVGNMAMFYRQQPDEDKRKIQLPR